MLPFRRDLVLQCLQSGAGVKDSAMFLRSGDTRQSSEELFQPQKVVTDHGGQKIQCRGLERPFSYPN